MEGRRDSGNTRDGGRDRYSSQNIFEIDSIRFSSNFDNGNLNRVEKISNKSYEYRIWSAPDNAGSEYETKHCTWFYFTITGLPSGVTVKLVSHPFFTQTSLNIFIFRTL
jgi:hypothetical protein